MSVLSMKKMFLCARKKDRKAILEAIQRAGIVEVHEIKVDNDGFEKLNLSGQMAVFERTHNTAESAIKILEKYKENKSTFSFFNSKRDISKDEYYKLADKSLLCTKIANEIVHVEKDISEKKAQLVKIESEIVSLKPWLNLDVSMRFKGTKKTAAFIGVLPQRLENTEILKIFFEDESLAGNVDINVVSSESQQTCIFVLAPKGLSNNVEAKLKSMGFSKPPIATLRTPMEEKIELEKKVENLKCEIKANISKILKYEDNLELLKFLVDYSRMRKEKYEVLSKTENTKRVFFLAGYVEAKRVEKLESCLNNNFNVALSFKNPDKEDDVPVVLENNKFSSPVEMVLESYSLPARGEVDPTSVMSIFYYILFGLMLSDAAYGAIVAVFCAVVLRKAKGMSSGLRKSFKMFMYCGFSTLFWGIMFGSYFGDAIDVISGTFFGHKVSIPALWFVPLEAPMFMLAFSFGLGIIHIFTGLFIKLQELIKERRYKDAVFDVASWYLLVGGLILYMLSVPMVCNMLTISFIVPGAIGTAGIVCAAIGAVLIVLTGGRESKNPLKRFLKGLYSLYGVTGYLGDILSYSRLLALGLATGVIAQVFNKMGTMAGTGIFGIIIFILVFIVGHTMNIAINLLGAYVHTNRLQFVEFLSKFYEGGGRKFSPFSANTKYFKVLEDINNG